MPHDTSTSAPPVHDANSYAAAIRPVLPSPLEKSSVVTAGEIAARSDAAPDLSREHRNLRLLASLITTAPEHLLRWLAEAAVTAGRGAAGGIVLGQSGTFGESVTTGCPLAGADVLLAPFHNGSVLLGTLWVSGTSATHRFDAEDARCLVSLGDFAAAAVRLAESTRRVG